MCLKRSCSTKKLYFVELGILKKDDNGWFNVEYFKIPIYIVAKAKSNCYKDILTKQKYNNFANKKYEDGDVVVVRARPIITTEKRFMYKDADKLIESRNCYYKVK